MTSDVVERTARLVEEHYVFPEIAAEVSVLLRDRVAGDAYAGLNVEDLAGAVTRDLQSVNGDLHLRLKHSVEELSTERDEDADWEQVVRLATANCGGVARVERLDENVGLLSLRPLLFPPGLAADAIAGAMTILASTDALVIDLRACIGGDPSMVAFLMTYLFEGDPVYFNGLYERESDQVKQFWTLPYVPGRRFGGSKPVYVLTGPDTFSGGEDLAYSLQQLGRARVVGERTRGGAHPRRGFRVDPHLMATIPVARTVNPVSGSNWEGSGVTPDIEVPAGEAYEEAYRRVAEDLRTAGSARPD